MASLYDMKSPNILSNIPFRILHRMNRLDSTSFTAMSFLPQRAAPVTAPYEAFETRSLFAGSRPKPQADTPRNNPKASVVVKRTNLKKSTGVAEN